MSTAVLSNGRRRTNNRQTHIACCYINYFLPITWYMNSFLLWASVRLNQINGLEKFLLSPLSLVWLALFHTRTLGARNGEYKNQYVLFHYLPRERTWLVQSAWRPRGRKLSNGTTRGWKSYRALSPRPTGLHSAR